ncbi:MAG TPA: hypothetical protein DF610_09900 [Sphingobacterium sp.]|jgi:hypothetical protein|nr:hypothetical protein [Sphingobacterium sp.]
MRGLKIFVTLILSCCFLFSKGQDKLYYMMTADSSLVGVRNEKGTIIIPPIHHVYHDFDLNVPIDDPFIEFIGVLGDEEDADNPAFAVSTVYDRKGNILYYPQFFDNGSDYWSEGLRRYVEKGKIGFVNLLGDKISPADWGFALPFNYGYATVYAGKMKKQYDAGGEHWFVVPAEDGVNESLINKHGVRVEPLQIRQDPKDYFYNGAYYPNPFQYNNDELLILKKLDQFEKAITFLFKLSSSQYEYKPLQLEIVEKPNRYFPYYVIGAYEEQRRLDDYDILFDEKSDDFYISQWDSRRELVPLNEGLISSIGENLQRRKDDIKLETRKLAEQELLKLQTNGK